MSAEGMTLGFIVGIGVACFVGIIASETRRPDIKHPPTPVRVLAKSEHRPREGRTGFELQFGAGGYVGAVWVDRIVYDAATHWSCPTPASSTKAKRPAPSREGRGIGNAV